MIIGLTGGFKSGKTTVARMFKKKKALIIDADQLAHQVLQPKSKSWNKTVAHFSKKILKANNQIDRNKLAFIVFKNKKELKRLNQIIHPPVISEIKKLIKKYKKIFPYKLIVVDVPLLFESGLNYLTEKVVVVKCSLAKQVSRASAKTKLNKPEIMARINSQWPLDKKVKLADFVIGNNGPLVKTEKQVEKIYRELTRHKTSAGQIPTDNPETSGLCRHLRR